MVLLIALSPTFQYIWLAMSAVLTPTTTTTTTTRTTTKASLYLLDKVFAKAGQFCSTTSKPKICAHFFLGWSTWSWCSDLLGRKNFSKKTSLSCKSSGWTARRVFPYQSQNITQSALPHVQVFGYENLSSSKKFLWCRFWRSQHRAAAQAQKKGVVLWFETGIS